MLLKALDGTTREIDAQKVCFGGLFLIEKKSQKWQT